MSGGGGVGVGGGGVGLVGWGGSGGYERRIEVFCENSGGSGWWVGGDRGDMNEELKFFVKIRGGGGRGLGRGGWLGGQGGCEQRIIFFCENSKKNFFGGGSGGGQVGGVGLVGWVG